MSSYVEEIGERLNRFERTFERSLSDASVLKRKVLNVLSDVRVHKTPMRVPKRFKKEAKKIEEIINDVNNRLYQERREYIRQQRLEKGYEDKFVVIIGGMVKRGKSTFSNCLAKFFEQGTGRPVKRFVLKQPTTSVPLSDAQIGGEVYAPWAKDALGKYHKIYETLKSNDFRLTGEIIQDLRAQGIREVEVGVEGGVKEVPIGAFETDVMEATVEIQGFESGRLVVFDSPGLASGNKFAVQRAKELWKIADLGIYFTSGDQPLNNDDIEIFNSLIKDNAFIIFCVNKCDSYEEDEVDGKIIKEWKYDKKTFEKQKTFIESEIKKAGLDNILINRKIVGISSLICKNSLENGKPINIAIKQGHIDDILRVLSDTLLSEGVRLKERAPKRRAIKIVDDLLSYLENEVSHEFLISKNALIGAIERLDISEYEGILRERLTSLLEQKVAKAQYRAEKGGEARLYVSKRDVMNALSVVQKKLNEDYQINLQKAIDLVPNMQARFEVRWGERIKKIKEKLGRTQTGTTVGDIGGAAAGAAAGAVFGPLGALVGAAIGGLIGSAIGEAFDEDKVEEFTQTYKVREGDNFEEEEQRIKRQMNAFIERVLKKAQDDLNTIKRLIAGHVEETEKELDEKIKQLKSIKEEVINEP